MHKNAKVNSKVKASFVTLIDSKGNNKGKTHIDVARQMAESQGLDLIVVNNNHQMPVCKIVDYGKMKFDQKKKNQKSKGSKNTLKEMWIGMNISEHDLQTKNRKVKSFLDKSHRVKYVLRLKGNNRNNTRERVMNFYNKAIEEFKEEYIVTNPVMSGNQVTAMISPK